MNKGLSALASAATSGNVVLVKAQIVCLCWRLGFSRTDQGEKLQPNLYALVQQLNTWPKWMCVRTAWPQSRALPDLVHHLELRCCFHGSSWVPELTGEAARPCCSSGLQGEWAQPRQGWGRLSDCTIFSYRACWDPGVVGEGLWLNAAWMYTCAIFFNLPVFCMCWSTSLLLLTLN